MKKLLTLGMLILAPSVFAAGAIEASVEEWFNDNLEEIDDNTCILHCASSDANFWADSLTSYFMENTEFNKCITTVGRMTFPGLNVLPTDVVMIETETELTVYTDNKIRRLTTDGEEYFKIDPLK
jgi:hypothetical protein